LAVFWVNIKFGKIGFSHFLSFCFQSSYKKSEKQIVKQNFMGVIDIYVLSTLTGLWTLSGLLTTKTCQHVEKKRVAHFRTTRFSIKNRIFILPTELLQMGSNQFQVHQIFYFALPTGVY